MTGGIHCAPFTYSEAVARHVADCRAAGVDPQDPQAIERLVDALDEPARQAVIRDSVADIIGAAFAELIAAGFADEFPGGLVQIRAAHREAARALFVATVAARLGADDTDAGEPE